MSTGATVNAVAENLVFGLDLGTTYCCVALFEQGAARTLQLDYEKTIFPSTITIQDGVWHVGKHRVTDVRHDDCNFIHGTKRVIGRDTTDGRLEADIKSLNLPFELDDEGKPFCRVGEQEVPPEQICAMFMLKAQAMVQDDTKMEVRSCIVSVPAWFTETQRQATLAAARIAGLDVLRLINEPTAIAAACLCGTKPSEDGLYGIFDLGGGTFDCSMVNLASSRQGKTLVVEATWGDNMLGGYDFTKVLTEQFRQMIGPEVQEDELWYACELAKTSISLSERSIHIRVAGQVHSLDVETYITACEPLLSKIRSILAEFSNRSDFTTLRSLILAGGSSLLPFIKDEIRKSFDEALLHHRIPLAEVVAQGNAIASNRSIVITEVLSRSIGIEIQDRNRKRTDMMSFLLDRNDKLPASRTTTFKAGDEEETEIKLYEGQHDKASSNIQLGQFSIEAQLGDDIEVDIKVQSDSTIVLAATSRKGNGNLKVERKNQLTDEVIRKLKLDTMEKFRSTTSLEESQKRKQLADGGPDRGNKRNKSTLGPEDGVEEHVYISE